MSAHAVPERSSPIKCVIVKCININKIQQLLALCLTENYVHICSDCPDRCALEDMKQNGSVTAAIQHF